MAIRKLLNSPFHKLVEEKRKQGLVTTYSVEVSRKLDQALSDLFVENAKKAQERQRLSWEKLFNNYRTLLKRK